MSYINNFRPWRLACFFTLAVNITRIMTFYTARDTAGDTADRQYNVSVQ